MRFQDINYIENTGEFKLGCIFCKQESTVDEQPRPGQAYECPWCGKSFQITRVFLCRDCSEVHVRGKEYPTSNGWEITK